MFGAGDIGSNAGLTMNQFTMQTHTVARTHIGDRFAPGLTSSYNSGDKNLVAVMYNADAFGVNVKLGTEKTFLDASIDKDNMNGLAAGVDSVFTPTAVPGLKIFASLTGLFFYGPDKNPDPLWGGTRIGYNIPLTEDISIEPWAGVDLGIDIKDDGGMTKPGYEVSFGGTMRWPGFAGWGKDYIINSDGRVFPGMSVGYLLYQDLEKNTDLEHTIRFTLFEPKGDEGIFYKIGSEIIVDIQDLTNVNYGAYNELGPLEPGVSGFNIFGTAYFDYELGKIGKIPGTFIPWTILYYDNLAGKTKKASDRVNNIKVDLGINLENAVANTTFGIVWNSGGLIQKTIVDANGTTPMVADKHQLGYVRLFAEIRL
jgi:hypothetical protein